MVVEVIIYDEDYPQGNSWKYGFADVDTAIEYMQKDKEHLQRLGGLTKRVPDACPYCAGKGEFVNVIGKALRCNHCAGTGQRR
jgi:DnaJ-class molecular chaperone